MDLKSERPKRSLWQHIADLALTDGNTITQRGLGGESIERLEQLLLEADFSVDVAMELVVDLERQAECGKVRSDRDCRRFLQKRIRTYLETDTGSASATVDPHRGSGLGIVLVLGVNGVGKTMTVAKLAHRLQEAGYQVLLAAVDTWRAGAQEQLRTRADRLGAQFVGGRYGADPASVAFDAVEVANARGVDWVLIDTAGRLHTQSDLMKELEKIDRVISRRVEGGSQERFLVIDATFGQNVLNQARQFGASLSLTGLVLAKFDSTARAGTVVSVVQELAVPVRFLGVGETRGDLELFSPGRYSEEIFSEDP